MDFDLSTLRDYWLRILNSEALSLVEAQAQQGASAFGLAEYLAALALFIVVLSQTDFRYRFRLAAYPRNMKRLGVRIALFVALALVGIDAWFNNGLPLPSILNSQNNLKLVIGCIFLIMIFSVLRRVFVNPIQFDANRAHHVFLQIYRYVHEGDPDRIRTITEELGEATIEIIELALRHQPDKDGSELDDRFSAPRAAWLLLELFGDKRLAKIAVDKNPFFVLRLLREVQRRKAWNLPIGPFARNVGYEFIANTNSAFHQELDARVTGRFGSDRLVTRIVFSDFEFIETMSRSFVSPFHLDHESARHFNRLQGEGYIRAALALVSSFANAQGNAKHHLPYSLKHIFDMVNWISSDIGAVRRSENVYQDDKIRLLGAVSEFIRDVENIVSVAKSGENLENLRGSSLEFLEQLNTDLAISVIFTASQYEGSPTNSWIVFHSTVWNNIFPYKFQDTSMRLSRAVNRKLYEALSNMNKIPNFYGARLIGFTLNIFGLKLHRGPADVYNGAFRSIQKLTICWIENNYLRVLEESPKVAEAIPFGLIHFDAKSQTLVKTYLGKLGKTPNRDVLALKNLNA